MNLVDAFRDKDEETKKSKRVYGVASGIVTNNQDPEGFGRVKIKFPWLEEESESDWVKIASFMAGKERGGVFLPEVDDEVLVAFEQGDINHPFVIGALWSQEDPPPETNADGKNNIRKFTSRSGHEIIFNDDAEGQQEKVEIHSKGGHCILLDDSTGQEKVVVKDKTGKNILKMDAVQNSVSIESSTKISIQAPMIEIKADGVLTLKGGMVKIN